MRIHGFLHRLRVLVSPESYAREVEAEIRFHLELEAMQARGVGLSEVAAESLAHRQFGNVTYVREEVRRMSGMEWIDRIRQDVAYALRGLARAPGFTAAVVVTLGLGLGVNAAMFTFLDRVFVKPPAAVERPDQVRRVYADLRRPKEATGRAAFATFKYPHIREIARQVDASVEVGVYTPYRDTMTIVADGRIIPARRTLANTAYFRTLGLRPALGRFFDPDEDRIETPAAVAVISHDLWRRRFAEDPHVVGSRVRLRDRSITIVGVAAMDFTGIDLDRTDFWMPINNYNTDPPKTPAWYEGFHNSFSITTRFPTTDAENRFVDVATRAFRGVQIPRWEYDTTALIRTGPVLSALGPARTDKEVSVSLRLGGVALIVLLIAVANVSNLLLVRATKRGREIAIRRALGVSRARLFEQLFSESLLLAAISGAVSIILAVWVGTTLRALLLPDVNWSTGALDARVVTFAGIATLAVGILIGLAPAVHAWRPDVITSLKSGTKNAAYRRSRLRSALLIAQAALSVVLLVGTGLFVKSLRNVQSIDVGYDVDHTIIVAPWSDKNGFPALVDGAMPGIMARLRAIEGVESVGSATAGPMQGYNGQLMFLPGRDSIPMIGGERIPGYINVSPDFFQASGVGIVAGRVFTEGDRSGVVISESMAKAYWPGESALTKCLIFGDKGMPCVPVIGVAENVHRFNVIEKEPPPQYYLGTPSQQTKIILRAPPERHADISRLVTAEVKTLLPDAAGVRVASMATRLEPEYRPWRLGATLFTAMGILALIVASIGVYSVVAYAVTQRTGEMGIRVALGAQTSDIARLVVGDGLRTIAVGIGLGIVLSIALGRLVASVLFGISTRDPWVLGISALVLALIGLAASIIPALRAARVDPVNALRMD